MITRESIQGVLGTTAFDRGHDKIGRVGNVYVDDNTGQPEWLTVNTGMFGRRETFVPVEPAEVRGDEVVVPFEKERITNAPNVDADAAGHLSEQDEASLYEYYGMTHPTIPAGTAQPSGDNAMTRSEQQLRVGTSTRETGRVHLRKYVVTEDESQTVPVHKETVRLEREPITDANRGAAMSGPDISEADYEVVRHEEEPVVATETVPKERVRLTKDESTEQQTVGGKVRKERVAVEGLEENRKRR
jgi:uncharacterized protein (TIGR02271 family)